MTAISAASAAARAASAPSPLAQIGNQELLKECKARLADGRLDAEDLDEISAFIETEAPEVDSPDDLITAAAWWGRGDKREALHFLEYALGRDFMGIGELRPEDLS
jgi:hypothetical protein